MSTAVQRQARRRELAPSPRVVQRQPQVPPVYKPRQASSIQPARGYRPRTLGTPLCNRAIQRSVEDDLRNLEQDYQQTTDPLLHRILKEVRTLSDIDVRSEPDPEQAHAARLEHGDRRAHEVVIDPGITDPVVRQSFLLHEMIHVSADRKYNANELGDEAHALTAHVDSRQSAEEQRREIGVQARYRADLVAHLERVVEGDFSIADEHADYIRGRLQRAGGAPHREFDTVLSELYYYLKKKGAAENTDTFREIAAMAAAAYRSRNEGRPLKQTYVEPMKTGIN